VEGSASAMALMR